MTDELNRLKVEEAQRAHDLSNQFFLAVNEATIQIGGAALRAFLFINGGAAVAILAFMGSVFSKDPESHKLIGELANGLTDFAWGVVLAAAAMGLAYIVNFLTAATVQSRLKGWGEHPYVRSGPVTGWWAGLKAAFHVLTVLLAIASVVLFVVGLLTVKDAVKHLA